MAVTSHFLRLVSQPFSQTQAENQDSKCQTSQKQFSGFVGRCPDVSDMIENQSVVGLPFNHYKL